MAIRLDQISGTGTARLDSIRPDPIRLDQVNKIGFAEAFAQDWEEKLPFSPMRAIETVGVAQASKRLVEDKYDVSFFLPEQKGLLPTDIGYVPPERRTGLLRKQKEFDITLVSNYLRELDERQSRGYTFWGRVGTITSEMPAFVTEFLATGGLKKLGERGAIKAGERVLGRYAATAAGKVAIGTGKFAAGAALRAAGMPHRATQAIYRRQLPKDIRIKNGEVKVIGPGESFATSVVKGLGDHYIEILSEQAGEFLSPIVGKHGSKYFKKLPFMGRLLSRIQSRWLKLKPGRTISDFTKLIGDKTGFHGVISEVGEEYLGDSLRAITDVDDFGAGEDASMLERLTAAVKQDTSMLPEMVVSFSIPGAISVAADVAITKQKARNAEIEKAYQSIIGLSFIEEFGTIPTHSFLENVTTAENMVGFDNDFFLEVREEKLPKYEFDVPGIGRGLTPKWLLNRLLGAETLLEDVDNAELARIVDERDLNSWIGEIIHKTKKEKGLKILAETLPAEAERELDETRAAEFQFDPGVVNVYHGVETGDVYPETVEGGETRMETVEGVSRIVSTQTGEELELDKELSALANREQKRRTRYEAETPEQRAAALSKTRAGQLLNKFTSKNPVHIMRDLLDTYEDAPHFLTDSERNIFNQIRELTRYLRTRANMVREKMGLEPIGDVQGYITHWMDATANKIVNRDVSIHSGYLYYLMKGLPKEVKNPTAMRRKIKKDLNNYFSKDLGKLLRVMTAMDLRDIYLTEPYQAAWEELQKLRKERLIPDSTFKQIEKYLMYDIRKFQTDLDKGFNRTMRKPIDLLNVILPARWAIHDPARAVFGTLRRLGHISGLGLRARPPIRNLGQRLLLFDLYRTSDYARAQAVAFRLAKMPVVKHPITGADIPLMDLIREQDWYKATLHKFEDITTTVTGVEQTALYIYGKTHAGSLFLSNVEVSALTGYFDWLNLRNQSLDTKSKHYQNCAKQAKRLGVPITELLTQDEDMLWNVREAVRRTQWEYMSISMPAFYRGNFKRAMGQFQSWWMNYFFNHCRECVNQISTGRNSLGRLLTPYGRLRAVKGMGTIQAIARTVETVFGIEMLKYLFMPVPGYLPPIPSLVVGLIQLFVADDKREYKIALSKVKHGLKFWLPFSAFGRDLNRLLSGEYSISDFLFYKKKEEK